MTTVSISDLGNVPAEYRHHPKTITAGDDLVLPAAHLKWYEVRREDAAVSDEIRDEARAYLRDEAEAGRLEISGELGFAILHLCEESFYFLIVCTWRNVNEMWESVYSRPGPRHPRASTTEPCTGLDPSSESHQKRQVSVPGRSDTVGAVQ